MAVCDGVRSTQSQFNLSAEIGMLHRMKPEPLLKFISRDTIFQEVGNDLRFSNFLPRCEREETSLGIIAILLKEFCRLKKTPEFAMHASYSLKSFGVSRIISLGVLLSPVCFRFSVFMVRLRT